MSNLTQTSKSFRKGVILFGILFVFYYVAIFILIPAGRGAIASLFPPKDPPTLLYGKLPQLEFLEKQITNTTPPTYFLDTTDGRLPPDVTNKVTIYKFIEPTPLFEKGKEAINNANLLGFTQDELITSLKETTYRWRSPLSGGILEINTNTKEISLETPLARKNEFFPEGTLNEQEAINFAKSILNRLGRFSDTNYRNGTQTATLGRIEGNNVIKEDSTFNAQVARVDFFRTIGRLSVVGQDPKVGLISMLVREPNNNTPYYNYPYLKAHVWQVESQSNATYPIITTAQAWENVKNNRGVITNITPEDNANLLRHTPINIKEIFINDIYLAYYETPSFQQYLQPIYVFEGIYTTQSGRDGEISVYYPAISPENIN